MPRLDASRATYPPALCHVLRAGEDGQPVRAAAIAARRRVRARGDAGSADAWQVRNGNGHCQECRGDLLSPAAARYQKLLAGSE